MYCFNVSHTLKNLTNTYLQSFNYDFIFQMRYELMNMIVIFLLTSILIKVSRINIILRDNHSQISEKHELNPHENAQYPHDDLTQSIIELLSDKKKRKAREIISELNLECDKKFLNRTYLYPMKKKVFWIQRNGFGNYPKIKMVHLLK